ncbi:ATP-binding protein [Bifidobacterium animalis]|uniref:ATP-binding protein n=1 Tax=Bifidobacterium animalis TaxID=28025 RepID=UPI0014300DD4|nr:AAA family ATPase [Bifidobacterium animalis]
MLIEGARRVGKSALAMEFATNEYGAHLLIDFSVAPPEVIDLFRNYRHDMDAFFRYLFAYYNFTPVPRDTLIIFDEVQLCPEARAFTKQLVADGRYDYLETGSLISIQRNVQHILLPSEEESITLHPFDFEEFLWARDSEPLANLIRDSFATLQPLPEALHRQATRLFREYMLVGGMPQAIQAYINENSFQAADEAKRLILTLYKNDIAKFGAGEEARISAVYQAIPSQLARHEKRFRITSLGKSARNRTYEAAFFWLADAGLVNLCFNTTDLNVGLDLTANRSAFKLSEPFTSATIMC